MGFSIRRLFRRVVRGVTGAFGGFLSKTLGAVLSPFKKALERLGKIPFLGKIIGAVVPFLAKLGPLAFLAGGPVGLALGLLAKASTVMSLANMASNFVKGGGGLQNMLPQGLNNIAEGTAWRHAQLLRF
ncbi:MAG: hypothetical protein HYS27_12620 [Deltaproteobacteria bacterium]|nr:hypothetical protein [Deltaproteobacteria bacterium]